MRKALFPLLASLALFASSCFAQATDQGSETKAALKAQRHRAETLRAEAKAGRSEAEAAREREYNECLKIILVNACQEKAREHYIERMKVVRARELEANTIDKEAKTKEAALWDAEHPKESAPSTDAPPALTSNIHKAPKPQPVKPTQRRHPSDTPPAPSASTATKASADKEHRAANANAAKAQHDADAAKRVMQARKDAAKYDANAQAIAKKKAERLAKEGAKAPVANSQPR